MVIVKNTADCVLAIPLKSGRHIQVAPGETTKPLSKLEVDNRTNKKLVERGCISMMEQKVVKSATDRSEKKKLKGTES